MDIHWLCCIFSEIVLEMTTCAPFEKAVIQSMEVMAEPSPASSLSVCGENLKGVFFVAIV